MHYHAEIWVPEPSALFGSSFRKNIDKAVEVAMAPHQEADDGESFSGFWDWWQIGGRYTGRHVPSYDPNTDPKNIETCRICNGTGFRTDSAGNSMREKTPSYTCDACGDWNNDKNTWIHGRAGAGKAVKWPTKWAPYPGDIMEVKDLPESLSCYTLIVKDQVEQKKIWNSEGFVATGFNGLVIPKLKELGITDGYLVTVDYHS